MRRRYFFKYFFSQRVLLFYCKALKKICDKFSRTLVTATNILQQVKIISHCDLAAVKDVLFLRHVIQVGNQLVAMLEGKEKGWKQIGGEKRERKQNKTHSSLNH